LRYLDGRKDQLQLQSRLLRRAHALVPDEIIQRILEIIDSENNRNGRLFVAREMEICWDERWGEALLEKSRSPLLKPQILAASELSQKMAASSRAKFLMYRFRESSRRTVRIFVADTRHRDGSRPQH
jgi:hypothetical protein